MRGNPLFLPSISAPRGGLQKETPTSLTIPSHLSLSLSLSLSHPFRVAAELGHAILAWRPVPTDASTLGASAVAVEPKVEQVFYAPAPPKKDGTPAPSDPEAPWYLLRKLTEHGLASKGVGEDEAYICSLSAATVVYKGACDTEQKQTERERERPEGHHQPARARAFFSPFSLSILSLSHAPRTHHQNISQAS